MCDVITLAGIALSAGSTVVNSMAASKVAQAREAAMSAERIRQQQLQQEAAALNAQARERYDDFSGQQDQTAQQLGDYFKGGNTAGDKPSTDPTDPNATAGTVLPSSSSQLVQTEQDKQGDKARAYTDQQATALGALRSFGDLMGGIGRDQARDSGYVGQLGNFMRGSSNVLGLELEQANHAGDGLKTFGDLLSGVGSISTAYGLSGGTPTKLASMFTPSNGTVGLTTGAQWLKG